MENDYNIPMPQFPPNTGLCKTCQFVRLIQSARGSVFVLCQAPKGYNLPKYPALPVAACPAHALKGSDSIPK
jgi:hypothetical protein